MEQDSRFVGLDVHAETIAVAVAEPNGDVRTLGTIPNTPEAVRRLVAKLGGCERLRVCYEAGPTGYVLYRQLTELGVRCAVVAPTLVPVKPGDRVKTDRRDAAKLARSHRSGDLTAVWVPEAAHEALRDLVRAREAAKRDQLRARHRVSKFLLRHGRRPPTGMKAWSARHRAWLQAVHFDHAAQEATWVDYVSEVEHATARIARLERTLQTVVATAPPALRAVIAALQALRGVAALTAVTIATIGTACGMSGTVVVRPTATMSPSSLVAQGQPCLIAVGREGKGARAPRGAETRRMHRLLRFPWARRRYATRKTQGERPFAEIKQAMGFRRGQLRGRANGWGEWNLVAAACNLRRLFALGIAPA